jgi:hypothetical protein
VVISKMEELSKIVNRYKKMINRERLKGGE